MLLAAKTYALISEYALICDMRLITHEYGIVRPIQADYAKFGSNNEDQ